LDVMFNNLAKDPKTAVGSSTLQQALKVTPAGLQAMADARDADKKVEEKGPDALPPSTDELAGAMSDLKTSKYTPVDIKASFAQQIPTMKTKGDLDKLQARMDATESRYQVQANTQAAQQSNRQDAFANAGLTANEKLLSDPHAGYLGARAQIEQTRASIQAGADGNGLLTALVPTMEVLGINHTAGVTRISPAEADAARIPVEFGTRWNAWFQKASQGKLTPEMARQGNQLMDILENGAHEKLIRQQQIIAARGIDTSIMPSVDINGNVTTLDTQLKGKAKAQNQPQNQSQSNVTAAPEGTIVNTANGQMVKQGGQWVPYQQGK
jgi:hypothetical protein